MKLFFRELGNGKPLIILHGLFGSSDNWLTIAKQLADDYKVYSVDQRNHGNSPHSDQFDYPTMADDLYDFITENNIDNPIIIGHSMGGKVAMQFAVSHPNMWDKLVVVDIAPKSYPVHHDKILEGLNSLNLSELNSRGDADKQLAQYVPEIGVRQFLLKNLSRDSDGFNWKINLPILTKNIEIIGAGLNGKLDSEREVLFINGANSGYIKENDFDLIREHFPEAEIRTIQNAGHWVHAEKPDEFMDIVTKFLKN